MTMRVGWTMVLALAACGAAPTRPPPPPTTFSGEALEVPVGGRMVDDRATTLRFEPLTGKTRVDGVHVELVYLGLLGNAPAERDTIRALHEEHRIVDGVEDPVADYRAEVRLDLARGKVLQVRGWSVGVIEASAASVRFVAVRGPTP